MAQFDVHRLRDGRDNLVVMLQSDVADELDTRIVAPLSDKPFKRMITGIRLEVDFGDGPYVLQMDRLAAIHKAAIGNIVGSIASEERRIKNAIDLLFFGV